MRKRFVPMAGFLLLAVAMVIAACATATPIPETLVQTVEVEKAVAAPTEAPSAEEAPAATAFPYPGQPLSSKNAGQAVEMGNWASGLVTQLAWSPAGDFIATSAMDGDIRLWSATNGDLIQIMGEEHSPSGNLAYAPDGNAIATGMLDGAIQLWNPTAGTQKQSLTGHTKMIHALEFSPDGILLASAASDGSAIQWLLAEGTQQHTLGVLPARITGLTFSPDGTWLVVAVQDGSVYTWSTADGASAELFKTQAPLSAIDLSPDGKRLAVVNGTGIVDIFELATTKQVLHIEDPATLGQGGASTLAFSPDGSLLAVGGLDGKLHLLGAGDGALLLALSGHTGRVIDLEFSPDGHYLASAGEDGKIRLWGARE